MTVLQEIKQRLDIVDVVGQYVTLRRSGRNFKAVCPFHSEKTPSFFVFPENQTWRCFGACAKGGDVVSFVMQQERLDFQEALARLAERAGVPLKQRWSPQEQDRYRRLEACNQAAADFFHNLLLRSPEAKECRAFLERRGVTQDTITLFKLGFSSADRDLLLTHLRGKGYEEREVVDAGLALRGEEGGVRDRFHNRLIFPIWSEKGRLTGFGARALDPKDQPKFLNTAQTPLFDKGATLYAAHLAQEAATSAGQVVIVEGYMDAVIAHQAGFHNVVASMGTALTDKQVALLKGMAPRFILALDADAAGDEATLRSLEESWDVFNRKARRDAGQDTLSGYQNRQAYSLSVLALPRGKDPDEVILESPQRWPELLAEATPLLDYLFEAVARKIDLTTDQGKTAALRKLAPLIARLEDVSAQDRYLERLSALVGVERPLLQSVWASLTRERAVARAKRDETIADVVRARPTIDPLEGYLVQLLYRHSELLSLLRHQAIEADHFEQTEHWELVHAIVTVRNPEQARERLAPALREHLDALLSRPEPAGTMRDREKGLAEVQLRLEERRLRRQKMAEKDLLLDSEQPQSQEDLEILYRQALELNKTLRETFLERKGLN